jgi:tRNA A37 threonylcarbamoyladenosine synthetase subunit TsaC/SUA5/YrdC
MSLSTKSTARIFSSELKNAKELAQIIAAGGIVAIPWGHPKRRIYCLICAFDNENSVRKMNLIKGRPANQPVALGCLPQHIKYVANISTNAPLRQASERLKISNLDELLALLFERSVGLILSSHDFIPEYVASKTDQGKTVLIAGEKSDLIGQDIYNQTLHELFENYGKVIAGTSANPSQKNVYSTFDQEEAYEFLKDKVDAFIKLDVIGDTNEKMHLTSSTIIDLSGDRPIVRRWGNIHPRRFKNIFPDLKIPRGVPQNQDAENTFDYLVDKLEKFYKRLGFF